MSFYIHGTLEVRCYLQAVTILATWYRRGDAVAHYVAALAEAYDRPDTWDIVQRIAEEETP